MNIVIAGGSGFIGQALVEHFLNNNHTVTVITRDKQHAKKVLSPRADILTWDTLKTYQARRETLVINLAGTNIGTRWWSKARKEAILSSRVNSTKRIIDWCIAQQPFAVRLFNASAVGIYGLQHSNNAATERLTEQSPLPSPATDFLSEVGTKWEEAANQAFAYNIPVTCLRFGVVLGQHGGILKQLKWPFLCGLGGPIGRGQQPFPWVSLSDVIAAIDFLIEHPEITGGVNIVSPNCVPQKLFAHTLANCLKRPAVLPIPSFAVKRLFGEMGKELLLGGQQAYPERLLAAGYEFQYPILRDAINKALAKPIKIAPSAVAASNETAQ